MKVAKSLNLIKSRYKKDSLIYMAEQMALLDSSFPAEIIVLDGKLKINDMVSKSMSSKMAKLENDCMKAVK